MSNTIASLVANISANTQGLEAGLSRAKGMMQQTAGEMKNLAGTMGNTDPYKNAAGEIANLNKNFKESGSLSQGMLASQNALNAGLAKGNPILMEAAKAAGLNSNQTFRMAEATGLYKQSQLAAASSSEILTKRSYALAEAVSKGKLTAEQAGQAYRKYYDEQQAIIKGSQTFSERMIGNFNSMKSVLGVGLAVAGGIYAGARAVGAVYEYAGEGAQLSRMQESYTTLASQRGYDPAQLMRSLQSVSYNTVAANDLMLASNQAMFLGVGKNTQEMANLMEVAAFRGRAMGLDTTQAFSDIVRGVGRMSPLILDNLGIVIDATRRYQEFADATGVSVNSLDKAEKRQILLNSVLEEGNRQIVLAGGLSNDTAASYERMGASWENFSNSMKMSSAETFQPVNNWLSQRFDDWSKWTGYVERAKNVLNMQGENLIGVGNYDPRIQQLAREIEQQDKLREAGISPTISQEMSKLDTASRGYLMQAAGIGAPGEGAVDAEKTASRDKMLLAGGLQLTQQTEQYTAATAELNLELARENEELARLTTKYGENSEKVSKQTEKVNDVKNKIAEVGQAAKQSGDAMLLSTIQNMGASDQQALEFARASGMISDGAYVQQAALNQIAEAYNAGKISADDAAAAGQRAASFVQGMNGMYSSATIDIFINYIVSGGGGSGFIPGLVGRNSEEGVARKNVLGQKEERRAAGGPLADITMVGEEGWEYVIRGTDGKYTVIPHEASMWMQAAGIMPASSMAGGGTIGGRTVSRSTGSGKVGGRSTSSSASSLSARGSFLSFSDGGGGGGFSSASAGSEISGIVQEAAGEIVPTIAGVVASVTANTVAGNPQIQALTVSLDEIKAINENLVSLIEKTATAGDIGRAVNGDLARTA